MFVKRSISIELYDNISPTKISGKGELIQVDKIAICIGRMIIDFSNGNHNSTNIQWLIGSVVQDNSKEFFLCLVKNRSSNIITAVLEKYILSGSIIISDGHLSYPVACRNLNLIHYVVNHTEGFVKNDGYIKLEICGAD